MKNNLKLKNNIRYAAAQFSYGLIACAAVCFITVFMLDRGYANSAVGIVIAAANIISAAIQPVMATIADKSRKISISTLIIIEAALGALLSLLVGLVPGNGFLPAAIFSVACALEMAMASLFNSLSARLEGVDFGVGRAFNSLSYALISAGLGIFFDAYPLSWLPIILMGIYILIGLVSLYVSRYEQMPEPKVAVKSSKNGEKNLGNPIRSKKFIVFLLANVALYTSYFTSVNCMIQICRGVGGGTEEMGIAIAIASLMEPPTMFFFSRLLKKINCRHMLILSAFMIFMKVFMLYLANSVAVIYIAEVLQIGGFALLYPATVEYVRCICDEENAARGQSYASVALSIGGILAGLIGGKLIDMFDVKTMLLVSASIAILGTIFVILGTRKVSSNTAQAQ